MTFFLSKFLLFIIRPLVWISVLAIYSLCSKSKRNKKRSLTVLIVLLLFMSNQFILGKVAGLYEPKAPVLAHYDVGLLLGGFSSYNEQTKSLKAEYSGDRLAQTVKLYHQRKIDRVLMSGGSGGFLERNPPEAIYAAAYLNAVGVPDSALIIEKESRNTKENFAYADKLLKALNKPDAEILVITSAWHIPRTKLLAEKQGLKNVTYYPTNSLSDNYSFEDCLLPQAEAIMGWELLIKEWVGYLTTKIGLT
ncbi:YdcF family protein [Pedobacter sp. SL55]|uniref:YdcF family protein n=1 Tax=Pedobacter sp. SL55 TaxID=2995161 RepID=UPI00227074B9|nr:YdcF family protein [Pedobacter sp. SL55]WAC39146.1 YdcF family protein [Pedobacter sp. SL55]